MRKFDIAAVFLIAVAGLLLTYQLAKPFWGQFDWTGAWFGTISRNYIELPVSQTKLAPITVSGTSNHSEWSYYNHYTITYPLVVAGSMAIFGDHEWSIRLVSLVFSLLMLGAFYLLCRKFFHPLVGIFGIFAVIFSPMFIYYGKLPVHEQPVLFFSLTSLYFYLTWVKSWSRSDFRKMLLFLALGFSVSWTGAYILALISAHLALNHKLKVLKLLPAYLIILLITALHFAHIFLSSNINDFSQALINRTSGGVDSGKVLFTPVSFVIKEIRLFVVFYTRPIALITFISFISALILSIRKRKISLELQLLIMFIFWGVFQWILVSRIAWIHDYMLIYFLPFVAFSSGLLFWKIYSRSKVVGLAIIFAAIFVSVKTSLPFTTALIFSRDQTGQLYDVAKYVKSHSSYGDRILVAIKPHSDFEIHYPIHYLSYYSDRYIKYNFTRPSDNFKKYQFVITPPNNFADQGVISTLNKNFKSVSINNFNIYETR